MTLAPRINLTSTATLAIAVSCGQAFAAGPVNFGGATVVATESSPGGVVAGDLDGDGWIDIVTTSNTGFPNDPLRVHWNDGTGSFPTFTTVPAGDGPQGMALADADNDGDLDLFVSNYFSNDARFIRNSGDRTFEPGLSYATGGGCNAIDTGDIDGDGDADFVATDKFGGRIRPYRNIDGLGFTSVGLFGVGADPLDLELADMDGDGDLDAVTSNEDTATVTIAYNAGDGTFPTNVALAVGPRPAGVATGDFNADGRTDIATANWGDFSPLNNTVSVLLADGDGGFLPASTYIVHGLPSGIVAEDVDADGRTDLIVTCHADDAFAVLPGQGDGTFADHVLFDLGARPTRIAMADFDGDGDADVATTLSGSGLAISPNISGTPIDPAPVEPVWMSLHDHQQNTDRASHVAIAPDGVVIAGNSLPTPTSADFLVVKHDPQGGVLWSHTFSGPGQRTDDVTSMLVVPNGDVLVSGTSWNDTFGVEWITLRLDADGNRLWTRSYDGGNPGAQQYARGMAADGSGNTAVCGWARDASFTTVHFSVVLYDAAGNQLWDIRIPDLTGEWGQAEAVAFDGDGNVLVTGSVRSADFGDDLMVAKIDPSGQILWTHQTALPRGLSIHADANGDVYVGAGDTLLKLDASGTVLWQQPIGGGMNEATRITPMADGSVLASGTGGGNLVVARFDPDGTRRWAVPTDGHYSAENKAGHLAVTPDDGIALIGQPGTDLSVILYDEDGQRLSETRLDSGSTSDYAAAIATAPDGAIYAAGSAQLSELTGLDFSLFRVEQAGDNTCPADLAAPFGVLDLADVQAFIAGFVAADPIADIAAPSGVLDLADVQAFIAGFTGGCP